MTKGIKIYSEYIYPINDYIKITKKDEFIFEWGFSIIISTLLYYFVFNNSDISNLKSASSVIVNCLAILIGFSVTCLTILATASEQNIQNLKNEKTERIIDNQKVTLYRVLIVNFIFLLLLELINLLLNYIFISIADMNFAKKIIYEFYGVISSLTLTIFLLNIRNITNFYFILIKT